MISLGSGLAWFHRRSERAAFKLHDETEVAPISNMSSNFFPNDVAFGRLLTG